MKLAVERALCFWSDWAVEAAGAGFGAVSSCAWNLAPANWLGLGRLCLGRLSAFFSEKMCDSAETAVGFSVRRARLRAFFRRGLRYELEVASAVVCRAPQRMSARRGYSRRLQSGHDCEKCTLEAAGPRRRRKTGPHSIVKIQRVKTASCVIGGFPEDWQGEHGY
jgi:hypothetical protein